MLRSRLPKHDLLLQIASSDRPDKDFFYGFSTLRELQFTETSMLVMEPWQPSDKLWEDFKEEGKNLGEKKYQGLGKYARTFGERSFLNYMILYVDKNVQAMQNRIQFQWAKEDSPLVRVSVWPKGAFKNKSIMGLQDFLMAPDESIR